MRWAPPVGADGFRYYGQWAGNERGIREDKAACIAAIYGRTRWDVASQQCSRKRGFGTDGLYCKQHAK